MTATIDQILKLTGEKKLIWQPLKDWSVPLNEDFHFVQDGNFDLSNSFYAQDQAETYLMPGYVVFIPDRDSFVIQYSLEEFSNQELTPIESSQRKLFELKALIEYLDSTAPQDFFTW